MQTKIKNKFLLIPLASYLLILSGCATGAVSKVVMIRSNPTGANIFVNGESIGNTPVKYAVTDNQSLIADTFYVQAFMNNYKPESKLFRDEFTKHDIGYIPDEIVFNLVKSDDQYASEDKNKSRIDASKDSLSKDKSEQFSTKWAVIIGVSDYNDSRIPPLRYAANDAQAFFDWAVSPNGGKFAPSHVKLLLNQEATTRNIKNALFVWLKQALEEDTVIIYFAGHGSPESPSSAENLFLLPYNTQYDDIATSAFPMWDIETALKRFIKAKKVIVIADACHAGGVGQDFDIVLRANRTIEVNPINSGLSKLSSISSGICVISASDDKQFSQESQEWGGGHGVFTFFLLEGLKGKADYNNDDLISLGELIPFLSEKVRRETKNAQSPIVSGKFDPSLTIGR